MIKERIHLGLTLAVLILAAPVLRGFVEVDASTFGFDENDSTAALQAAIDSGADRVIVPYMGSDWIVEPIFLASNQEIFFEPGVIVTAKQNSFQGVADVLISARDRENIVLSGYGATLRMRKSDYQGGGYEPGEWRHTLALYGVTNVVVEGFTLRDSGGDGIYIGSGNWTRPGYPVYGDNLPYCQDIVIRDVIADNNHRQGMSITSAKNLLVEDSVFRNTAGTAPQAGVNIETSSPHGWIVGVVLRNIISENNAGDAFFVHLGKLDGDSQPVSIRLENCIARNGGLGAYSYLGPGGDAPVPGWIEVVNLHGENMGGPAINFRENPASGIFTRFVNCTFTNVSIGTRSFERHPIWFQMREGDLLNQGGVEFVNLVLNDNRSRPFLRVENQGDVQVKLVHVWGDLTVNNPSGVSTSIDPVTSNVDLRINQPPPPAGYRTGFNPGHNYRNTINESVIGVDGWHVWTLQSDDPMDARLVRHWDGGSGNALYLTSTSTLHIGHRRTRVVRSLDRPASGLVHVSADLAFEWRGNTTNFVGIQINPWETAATIFGFSPGDGMGLFYESNRQRITILPTSEVKPGSTYSFTLLVNTDTNTFSIQVNGVRADGSPLAYSATGLVFRYPSSAVTDIRVKNGRGDTMGLYVGNVVVAQGPLGLNTVSGAITHEPGIQLVIPRISSGYYQIQTTETLAEWINEGSFFRADNQKRRYFFPFENKQKQFYRVLTGGE